MNKTVGTVRRLYTHNTLIGAALDFSKLAQRETEFHASMATALLCALALESTLNHVGASLLPLWDKHLKRKLNPEGKLALVASVGKLNIDPGKKPFQAFNVLFQLRNQLAHGSTQDLSYEKARHWLVYGKHKWPAAHWETLCTKKHAASLVADTERMIERLLRISGVEWVPRFLLSEHVVHAQPGVPADGPRAARSARR